MCRRCSLRRCVARLSKQAAKMRESVCVVGLSFIGARVVTLASRGTFLSRLELIAWRLTDNGQSRGEISEFDTAWSSSLM